MILIPVDRQIATPFCLTNSTSYVQGYNGKTVRNDKSSVIASASEAISPLVCRQIATPFCLTNSASYVQDNNGKTVLMTDSVFASVRSDLLFIVIASAVKEISLLAVLKASK